MDYGRIYSQLIENRKNNPISGNIYTEKHHIIPRCLGGDNSKDNLIKLSAREHFICHALLAEIYPKYTHTWYKLNHAFLMMRCRSYSNQRYNSRLYELKKKDFSEVMRYSQSGNKNSQLGSVWIYSISEQKCLKIKPIFLEKYLNIGFQIGRVIDFSKKIDKLSNPKLDKIKSNKTSNSRTTIIFQNKEYITSQLLKFEHIFGLKMYDELDIQNLKNHLYMLYHVEKMSLPNIANKYDTSHVYILNCLKKFDIPRRTLSDSQILCKNK